MAKARLLNERKQGSMAKADRARPGVRRKPSPIVEEQFRLALEATPAAMIMVDGTGQIVFINALAEALFGYTRTEVVGRTIEVLVPERLRSSHPDRRNAFLASPSPRAMGAGRELYALRKDGREIPV